jgi:hypothetical protein
MSGRSSASMRSVEAMPHCSDCFFRGPTISCFFSVRGLRRRPDRPLVKFVSVMGTGRGGCPSVGYATEGDGGFSLADTHSSSSLVPLPASSASVVACSRGCYGLVDENEKAAGRTVECRCIDVQPTDVLCIEAAPGMVQALIACRPATPIEGGVHAFIPGPWDGWRA